MPGGQPTSYDEKYCDFVIELGKQGKSFTQMASEIGVSKQTLYNWRSTHSLFFDALEIAKTHAQNWWENTGQSALFEKNFQSAVYNKQISCRFADDYTEQSKVDHTTAGQAIKPVQVVERIVYAVDEAKPEDS